MAARAARCLARLLVGNLKRNKKTPPRRRAFRYFSEKIARETEKKRFMNS